MIDYMVRGVATDDRQREASQGGGAEARRGERVTLNDKKGREGTLYCNTKIKLQ